MNTLFNDRASYIAYRTTWKADYKALSIKIRETKHLFKAAQRVTNNRRQENSLRYDLAKLKRHANEALQQLVEAKIQAAAQRNAEIASK